MRLWGGTFVGVFVSTFVGTSVGTAVGAFVVSGGSDWIGIMIVKTIYGTTINMCTTITTTDELSITTAKYSTTTTNDRSTKEQVHTKCTTTTIENDIIYCR